MTDFYGNINWWGFSPALDLQEVGLAEMSTKLSCAVPDELHILLVGAGDIRHILKTVARRYRHTKRKLKFYVTDAALELYARDMLLMMVALEQQKNMGLQEKTELFLELYGNSLVRQQSSQYVGRMAHELIKMVTDFDYLEKKLPFIDLSQLKYKERDFLEGILKFWRNREKVPFDIAKCWELRLRQLLGVRYDSRGNVFDWDYNMEMLERGGSIVYLHQYKAWRERGVAFQIREGTYDVPNRTLSSGMVFKHDGERYPRRGYWGDMIVSPYVAFGIETEEKSFYQKKNNQHTKTAEDVSEFNIISLFYELVTNEKYELPKEEPKDEKGEATETAKLEEITEETEEEGKGEETKAAESEVTEENVDQKEKDQNDNKTEDKPDQNTDADYEENVEQKEKDQNENKTEDKPDQNTDADYDSEWLSLEDVKVIFLPLACTPDLLKKNKYHKLFNAVFFSNSMIHHLKPEVSQLFADKCSVILETALFMLDVKKDTVKEFVQKISGMAKAAGCKELEKCDELQDSYMKFYFER